MSHFRAHPRKHEFERPVAASSPKWGREKRGKARAPAGLLMAHATRVMGLPLNASVVEPARAPTTSSTAPRAPRARGTRGGATTARRAPSSRWPWRVWKWSGCSAVTLRIMENFHSATSTESTLRSLVPQDVFAGCAQMGSVLAQNGRGRTSSDSISGVAFQLVNNLLGVAVPARWSAATCARARSRSKSCLQRGGAEADPLGASSPSNR